MYYREISEAFLTEQVVQVGKFYGTWLHGLKGETAKDYLLFGLELKKRLIKNNLFIHAIPRLPDLHIPEGKAAKEVDVWRYVQEFLEDFVRVLGGFSEKDPIKILRIVDKNMEEAVGYWISDKYNSEGDRN